MEGWGGNWLPIVVALAAVLVILVLWRILARRGQKITLDIDTSRTSGLAVKTTAPPPPLSPDSAAKAAPVPAPVPAPAPGMAHADDLTLIKGIGPKIAALLQAQGITSYADIAAWTDSDIARIDAHLGNFAGRATRDQWVEQCRLLAAGDKTGFEARYGALNGNRQ